MGKPYCLMDSLWGDFPHYVRRNIQECFQEVLNIMLPKRGNIRTLWKHKDFYHQRDPSKRKPWKLYIYIYILQEMVKPFFKIFSKKPVNHIKLSTFITLLTTSLRLLHQPRTFSCKPSYLRNQTNNIPKKQKNPATCHVFCVFFAIFYCWWTKSG